MDDDPLPLSALEHWSYCARQCCLIHAEPAFEKNVHTLRGRAVHERVDKVGIEAGFSIVLEGVENIDALLGAVRRWTWLRPRTPG